MATNPNATQITPPRVSIIDERTGAVSREWYRWFYSLYTFTGEGTGILPVTSGGTGLSTIPTNGQLLIGNGTGYALNTLTASNGIAVTNAAGSITVANSGVLSNVAGTGITVSSATGNVTVAIDNTVATLTGIQTLQNKTLDNTNTVTLTDTLFTLQDNVDPTKQAQFQLSGLTTGTTFTYTLPAITGSLVTTGNIAQTLAGATTFSNTLTMTSAAFTRTATTQAWLDGSMSTGTWTVGGTAQTGAITLGRSTGAQTLNIATGATTAATTKVINIGTGGVNTSTTTITSGSSLAGALVTHTWNAGANNMTLDSGGNLLVNDTTNPASARFVSVGGSIQLSGGTTAQAGLRVQHVSSVATVTGINNDNNAFNPIAFYTGVSEAMRITTAGVVGIGTSSPSASAILDAQSTTQGVRFPNMTTTQKNAISSPAAGLVVFDTTLVKLCVYSGTAWETITSI